MFRMKPYLSILALVLIVASIGPEKQSASGISPDLSELHFGKNIILFRFEDEFLEARLSSNGSYVFGYGVVFNEGNYLNGHENLANLYLWDIRKLDQENVSIAPEAISSVTRLTTEEYYGRGIFSPNADRLAFRIGAKLEILTVPELQEIKSLDLSSNIPTSQGWAWSDDGKLLAALSSTDATIWQIDTDRIETHPFENSGQYSALSYFDTGWLLKGNLNQSTLFEICTQFVESCAVYKYSNTAWYETASSHAKIILAAVNYVIDDMTLEIGVWRRQVDDQYVLTETLPRDICRPRNFSPDNRYLVVYCYDSRAWQIWDFATLEVMSSIATASTKPFWLPDSQHLVALERGAWNLILYEAGNSEPLEILHLPSIAGFENLQDWVDGERFSIESISADGKLVLINLGWASILVPIVYE